MKKKMTVTWCVAASKFDADTYNKLFCMMYSKDGTHTFSVSRGSSIIVAFNA